MRMQLVSTLNKSGGLTVLFVHIAGQLELTNCNPKLIQRGQYGKVFGSVSLVESSLQSE
jgi:hypothetical protein